MTLQSPYQIALGERFNDLHPALRSYFSGIAESHVGVGEGTFLEFGTPRRWLWPLLRPFERAGVLVAGHAHSVPFRVENRTVTATDGTALAVAHRELLLPGRRWVMKDSVAVVGQRVIDRLGDPRCVVASFDVRVNDSALELVSNHVGLRFGSVRVRVPAPLAPKVRLRERFDDVTGMQHVELTIDAPLLGRVYAYKGNFTYRVEKESFSDEPAE